jgi:hypothetical protein
MTYSKQDNQNYVVLPPYLVCLLWTVILTVCVTAIFLLWPVYPEIEMEELNVRQAKVHPLPPLSADVALSLTAKIHNKGLLWLNLEEVDIGVKYRGNKLGHVESEGRHVVNRWGLEHVYGEIEFGELPSPDVAHLMKDLAKDRVHFHTSVRVTANFGLFFFHFPNIFKVLL